MLKVLIKLVYFYKENFDQIYPLFRKLDHFRATKNIDYNKMV